MLQQPVLSAHQDGDTTGQICPLVSSVGLQNPFEWAKDRQESLPARQMPQAVFLIHPDICENIFPTKDTTFSGKI